MSLSDSSMGPDVVGAKGRRLIWADEFDRDGRPDPARWRYERGFIRNEEVQYYTSGRADNARIEAGCLRIEARRERMRNPRFRRQATDWRQARPWADYTSASLTTQSTFQVRWGRVEARARLPRGDGVWPAIWLLGASIDTEGWPACGEIDLMEYIGREPRRIHGTVHFAQAGVLCSRGGSMETESFPYDDFHRYAIDWTPTRIRFWFDDRCYQTFEVREADGETGNPFHRPFFLIINLALGGPWAGPVDDTVLPQSFGVDYIRVYSGADEESAI